ncbi:EhaG family protein [Methanothermococcus sp.]|uniref:EhaG family protein n=1 Tax=Methanothermococcus sp. TaxID=2614238 RepID=UPI0025CFCDAD|nr:EhaG family protein [Methanothermococcus sp.]
MNIVSYLFNKTVIVGFIIGILSLYAISRQKSDLHMLLLSDLVECAMLVVIAAVGTDLAEALILPGLVVGMAELLAVSEVLVLRNEIKYKKKSNEKSKLLEEFIAKETPPNINIKFGKMEVLYSSPKFVAFILVVYGALLTGFTGGAVMASGLLFYLLSLGATGNGISLNRLKNIWESISGFSGIMWAFWILFGFIGFFLYPQKYLYFLLIAGCALALKVGSKLGLIGNILK